MASSSITKTNTDNADNNNNSDNAGGVGITEAEITVHDILCGQGVKNLNNHPGNVA